MHIEELGQPWFVIHNNLQKVGIGSTVPTASLDVAGSFNVTGVSTFGNRVGIGTTAPQGHSYLQTRYCSGSRDSC